MADLKKTKEESPGKLHCKRKCLAVLQGPPQDAQRYALFPPIYGKNWQTEKDLRVPISGIRRMYQDRVRDLFENGELPGFRSNPSKRMAYMTNCPAATVLEYPIMKLCQSWNLCPFCYCRFVVKDAYCLLADVMRCGRVLGPRPDGMLVGVVSKMLIPDDEDAPRVMRALVRDRQLFVKATKAIGAWVGCTVQPAMKPRHWEIARRELLIVPVGLIPDEDEMRSLTKCCHYYQEELPVAKREKLSSLVGNILQYPEGMLLRDARTVGRILAATHKLRLRTTTGIIHGAERPEPSDEHCHDYVN